MPDALFELDGVSVAFGPQTVLRNLSLTVHRGETLAVIGESGCGKTCLLKLLVGLMQPDRGNVCFEGASIATMTEARLREVRQRIGFLFQGAALFDSLSVFENVAFPQRSLKTRDEPAIRETVRARLAEVGLPESAGQKQPSELSGGMRKRVGLARALALDPEVMLYDEPTTGLDPVMTGLINDLIVETRRKRPMTCVVVTHEMRTVRHCADRVVMLSPATQIEPDASQILSDGPVAGLDASTDPRVRRFVRQSEPGA
jgi:phospholipid/cholesterol/gamma-HCH transport system ATP-binding protein